MRDPPRVARVRFSPAPPAREASDLLGFASCSIADIGRIDGLAVRRVADGRYAVTFPGRRDRLGRRHLYFRPRDARARREIERRVIEELLARGVLP